MHNVHCTTCTIHCTLNSVQCILYSVLYNPSDAMIGAIKNRVAYGFKGQFNVYLYRYKSITFSNFTIVSLVHKLCDRGRIVYTIHIFGRVIPYIVQNRLQDESIRLLYIRQLYHKL